MELIHTSAHYRRTLFLKISSFGLELCEKHLARPHFDRKSAIFTRLAIATPALQRATYNRLARIGGVKLVGLDRVSFESRDHCCGGAPYTQGGVPGVGRLNLTSVRANSPTCLSQRCCCTCTVYNLPINYIRNQHND